MNHKFKCVGSWHGRLFNSRNPFLPLLSMTTPKILAIKSSLPIISVNLIKCKCNYNLVIITPGPAHQAKVHCHLIMYPFSPFKVDGCLVFQVMCISSANGPHVGSCFFYQCQKRVCTYFATEFVQYMAILSSRILADLEYQSPSM